MDQELVLIMDDWRLDENVQIDEASFATCDWSHNGVGKLVHDQRAAATSISISGGVAYAYD